MTINPYSFPLENQCVFIDAEQKKPGKQWAIECIALAQEISGYSEQNWLLYQDDFYQYSQCFFALLIAGKNIVLAQSEQPERFKQAAVIADICIGQFKTDISQCETSLPLFQSSHLACGDSDTLMANNKALAINADLTITLFTSGSTGEAKAIKKYWYQLANEVESLQLLFPQSAVQETILSTVTHKHIYGLLFKLIWPVFANKQIMCETIEYPEQVEHISEKFKNITLISSPSYLARTSKQLSKSAALSIKRIFCSGGALSANVAHEFLAHNSKVITEIYGSTETGGIAWRKQVENSLWQLFPEHQVTVEQDSTLRLNSKFLAKNETYKTDDRVELDGRYFKLIGRVDRIIKLYEKRLSLDEMEKKLNSLSKVNACRCFMLDSVNSKTALVSVVELDRACAIPDGTTQKKQLVNECKKALLEVFEPSLIPRKWRFVQQLPFNSQGKLVKTELEKLFL